MGTIAKTTLGNSTQVLAPWALIKGDRKLVTIDLRTKMDAVLQVCVANGGTTNLTVGADVIVRRYLYNSGVIPNYSATYWSDKLRSAAATAYTSGYRLLNGALSAGVTTAAWDGAVGTAAVVGDQLVFWGVTAIPGASGAISPNYGCEAVRLDVVGTSGSVNMQWDEPTVYAHNDNEIVALGSVWDIPLEGGWLYKLLIDYASESASSQAILAFADLQTIDTYTTA